MVISARRTASSGIFKLLRMKQLSLLFSALFVLCVPLRAQTTGTFILDEGNITLTNCEKILRTSDGGLLAIGTGNSNAHITKFDSLMAIQWIDVVNSVGVRDIIETNDGNYVFMGTCFSVNYNMATLVVKIAPAGNILYQKVYYAPTSAGAQLTSAGICKGAGSDNGFLLFGGECVANDYIMKCDAAGNVQWQHQYIGASNGSIMGMVAEPNSYAAAYSVKENSVPSVGILKIDASGNLLWAKVLQSSDSVELNPNSFTKRNNGDYVIWASPGYYTMQIYSIDASGNNANCKLFTTPNSTYFKSINATHNLADEIIGTGFEAGDGLVFKFDPFGVITWQRKVATIGNDGYYFSTPFGNSTYAVAGYVYNSVAPRGQMFAIIDENATGLCTNTTTSLTTSTQAFNFVTPTITVQSMSASVVSYSFSTSATSYTRIVLCGNVTAVDETPANETISLSPNPVTDQLTLNTAQPMKAIRLFDGTGRILLQEENVNASTLRIDLQHFPKGIYFAEIITGDQKFLRKISKQ